MTYLLDVNVLIALLDQDHVYHDAAQRWFETVGGANWATCPITENGVVRILGHARDPKGPGTPGAAAELLAGIRRLDGHNFWGDEISLFAGGPARPESIATPAQVTDTYLLALAVHRGGRLATLDRRLTTTAVADGAAAVALIS